MESVKYACFVGNILNIQWTSIMQEQLIELLKVTKAIRNFSMPCCQKLLLEYMFIKMRQNA